jgi:ferritin-like metal-binding protein YciE
MKLETLEDLLLNELEDIYDAEKQLVEALPKMAQTATSPELKESFVTHLQQTKGHVIRLEQVFSQLGSQPKSRTCKAMKGLIAEGAEVIGEKATPEIKDAGLISAAQRVEHYEIAAYGTARTYAQQLNISEAAELLDQTLKEEAQTDRKLTDLAVKVVNPQLARAA